MPEDYDYYSEPTHYPAPQEGQTYTPSDEGPAPTPTDVAVNYYEQLDKLESDLTPPESGQEGNHG